MKVKLKDIADTLEQCNDFDDFSEDGYTTLLDRETYEIVSVSNSDMSLAEDGDDEEIQEILDLDNWQSEALELAIKILESDPKRYVCFYGRREIDEYSMMENFIYSLNNDNHINRLNYAISGKGAFRMFKAECNNLGLIQKWYDFKQNEYLELAKKWCAENEIEYEI